MSNYSQELVSLFNDNELISQVWVNEDATVWHTHQVDGLIELTREEVLGEPQKTKNHKK
jgi:hypothetical protein